ncbi:hypothetical protein C8R45DRAFT_934010 [Mycena sanguinolenta]|nr:hypothetical protein C8R45DRAFT_934010 [Mycena sanguinolenta]
MARPWLARRLKRGSQLLARGAVVLNLSLHTFLKREYTAWVFSFRVAFEVRPRCNASKPMFRLDFARDSPPQLVPSKRRRPLSRDYRARVRTQRDAVSIATPTVGIGLAQLTVLVRRLAGVLWPMLPTGTRERGQGAGKMATYRFVVETYRRASVYPYPVGQVTQRARHAGVVLATAWSASLRTRSWAVQRRGRHAGAGGDDEETRTRDALPEFISLRMNSVPVASSGGEYKLVGVTVPSSTAQTKCVPSLSGNENARVWAAPASARMLGNLPDKVEIVDHDESDPKNTQDFRKSLRRPPYTSTFQQGASTSFASSMATATATEAATATATAHPCPSPAAVWRSSMKKLPAAIQTYDEGGRS